MEFPKVDGGGVVSQWLRRMRRSNIYKPQSWRWLSPKQASNKSLDKVIDKEEAFRIKPSFYMP